jgi:CubicO group peptidase (beta-lactamase class C family)
LDSAKIDERVQASLAAWGAPGVAVAVVQGDEVVYLKGVGVRETGKEEPVTPDSLFAIASTTKAFTCTALAMLAEEGKLSWDDPVRKHVAYFRLSDPLANENVTLRDLVTHRTGVSRHDMLWYGSDLSREEIIRRIGIVAPNTSFRSKWEYNNIMYLTAGVAAGNADGSTWEEVVRKRIFEPLGMTRANFSVRDVEKSPDHVSPHDKDRSGTMRAVPWRNLDNCAPGGAINAGVRDLSKWLRFQLADGAFEGKQLIAPEKLQETRSPHIVVPTDPKVKELSQHTNFECYGLGWGVYDYHGHQVFSHGGGIDGFRSQVVLVPHIKLGLAILSNLTPTSLPEALRNSLIDLALGLPMQDWDKLFREKQAEAIAEEEKKEKERDEKRHKDTKPSRELAAYTGAYENPAYGTAHVTLENGALSLQWSWYKITLEHFHFDTFLAKIDYPRVNELVPFTLDGEGEVKGLTIIGQEFRKAKPASP